MTQLLRGPWEMQEALTAEKEARQEAENRAEKYRQAAAQARQEAKHYRNIANLAKYALAEQIRRTKAHTGPTIAVGGRTADEMIVALRAAKGEAA